MAVSQRTVAGVFTCKPIMKRVKELALFQIKDLNDHAHAFLEALTKKKRKEKKKKKRQQRYWCIISRICFIHKLLKAKLLKYINQIYT